jgi:hypothetical protein
MKRMRLLIFWGLVELHESTSAVYMYYAHQEFFLMLLCNFWLLLWWGSLYLHKNYNAMWLPNLKIIGSWSAYLIGYIRTFWEQSQMGTLFSDLDELHWYITFSILTPAMCMHVFLKARVRVTTTVLNTVLCNCQYIRVCSLTMNQHYENQMFSSCRVCHLNFIFKSFWCRHHNGPAW